MARSLNEVLDEIGEWDDPAEEFRKRGIKGKPVNSCACPFAVYLHRETGLPVQVSQYDVTIPNPNDPFDLKMAWLPVKASEFIEMFDNGEYPDLEIDSADVR